MAGRYSVEGVFRLVDRMTRPIQRIQSRFDRFQRALNGGARDLTAMFGQFRTGFIAIGAAITAAAGGIAVALRDIVDVGMEFEQTLTRAASKFPGQVRPGTEAFGRLEEAARRVGAETQASSSGAAGALDALAGAGLNADQAISALPGVVTLATAAQLELEEATGIAANTLGVFGLRARDSAQLATNLTRVNDVLARTAADTDASVTDLFESIQNGGVAAHSAGVSIETFAAMAGALSSTGLKGAEAGTALRNVFQSLAAPTARARRELRRLHVSAIDPVTGQMRDTIEIIGDLNRAMAGMSNAQRLQAVSQIFERATSPAVLSLMEAGSDELGRLRTRLEGASGAAAEMAEVMGDTTAGDMAEMDSAIESLKLGIFDLVKGPLRQIIQGITEWVRANEGVIRSGIEDTVTFLIENMPTIVTWARRIAIGIGLILTPIALATAALMAINVVVIGVAVAIVEGLMWLHDNARSIWESIVAAFTAAWDAIVAFFMPAIEFIVGLFVLLGRHIEQQMQPWIALFRLVAGVFMAVWRPVAAFFMGLWTTVSGAFRNAWAAIVGEAGPIVETLQAIWEPIGDFFAGIWQGIADAFNAIMGPVIGALSGVVDRVSAAVGSVRETGREAMGTEGSAASRARVVSPQERTARSISETTRTERAEVTIRDETGRARTTRPRERRGSRIQLQPSGAM